MKQNVTHNNPDLLTGVNTMKKNRIYQILTNPVFITLFLFLVNFVIAALVPMNQDEGIWSYIGRVWIQNGIPPYTGTVENKTPGIFELFAFSNALFGMNLFFVRGIGILSVLISSITVYLIGTKIHSQLTGVFSMYLFGLTSTWGLLNGVFVSHTEVFMVMFSTISFYLVIKGKNDFSHKYRILLAGISMGLAIAFKQIAITTTLALILFYIYTDTDKNNPTRIRALILFVTGIFISTFLSILPLLLSNVPIKEYVNGAWLILLNQGSHNSLTKHLSSFLDILVFSRLAFFYPFILLLIWKRELLKNKYFTGLLIWFLFDFIGVNSSGIYSGHQIRQLMPSLSIISGVLLVTSITGLFQQISSQKKYLSIILITLILIMLPYGSLVSGTKRFFTANQSDPDKEIGIWLRANSKNNDYIYIIENTSIPALTYSERVSSSKYFTPVFITSETEREIVLNDLISKPPVLIVKYNSESKNIIYLGPKIENFIINNYTFMERKYEYDILKRKN